MSYPVTQQTLLSLLKCAEADIFFQCDYQQILSYCVSCTCTGCDKARKTVEHINAKSSSYPKTTFLMSLLGSATTFTGLHASMKACFIPCCATEGCAITTGAMGVVLQAFYEYILITKSGPPPISETEPLISVETTYVRVPDSSKNVMFFFCFVASVCSAILVFVDMQAILGAGIFATILTILFAMLNFIVSVLSGQNVLEKFFEVIIPKIKKDMNDGNRGILTLLAIYTIISFSVMFTYSAPIMHANPFWDWDKAALYQKVLSMLPAMVFNASVIPSYFNFAYDFIHGQVGPKDSSEAPGFNPFKWIVVISMLPFFILSAAGNGLSSGKLISDSNYIKIILAVCQGITVFPSSCYSAMDLRKLVCEALPSLDRVSDWGRANCCTPCLVTTQPGRMDYRQIDA
jgi:hypothetical protein